MSNCVKQCQNGVKQCQQVAKSIKQCQNNVKLCQNSLAKSNFDHWQKGLCKRPGVLGPGPGSIDLCPWPKPPVSRTLRKYSNYSVARAWPMQKERKRERVPARPTSPGRPGPDQGLSLSFFLHRPGSRDRVVRNWMPFWRSILDLLSDGVIF